MTVCLLCEMANVPPSETELYRDGRKLGKESWMRETKCNRDTQAGRGIRMGRCAPPEVHAQRSHLRRCELRLEVRAKARRPALNARAVGVGRGAGYWTVTAKVDVWVVPPGAVAVMVTV